MTGRASSLLHEKQNGVVVAIESNSDYLLRMTRSFALAPELATTSAPIMGFSRPQGRFPGFAIHPGEHKDFAARRVLNYSGQKPSVKPGRKIHFNASPRKYCTARDRLYRIRV